MAKTVLAVDDSATMLANIKVTLENAGYRVLTATGGAEALRLLQGAEPVHAVLTDVNMPQMNGIELVRAIRQLPRCRFVPVIVLTTVTEAARKEEARQAGATGWIVKPFKPDQLVALLKKVGC
jgi:two-component system chemotaxis response regulator CheY